MRTFLWVAWLLLCVCFVWGVMVVFAVDPDGGLRVRLALLPLLLWLGHSIATLPPWELPTAAEEDDCNGD